MNCRLSLPCVTSPWSLALPTLSRMAHWVAVMAATCRGSQSLPSSTVVLASWLATTTRPPPRLSARARSLHCSLARTCRLL